MVRAMDKTDHDMGQTCNIMSGAAKRQVNSFYILNPCLLKAYLPGALDISVKLRLNIT